MQFNLISVCLSSRCLPIAAPSLLVCGKQGSSEFQCRKKKNADTLLEEDVKVSQGT